jgi:RNase P/RNase MRP subunit p29
MIAEEQLDKYRIDGTLLRVVRDANRDNDVRGFVVAWDESTVVIRKRSTRRLVKLDRRYVYQPHTDERALPPVIREGAIGSEEPGDEKSALSGE